MPMIVARCLFAAVILAGVVAVIGGAAFADGGLSPLHYLASLAHPELALALITGKTDLHQVAQDGDIVAINRLIDGGAGIKANSANGKTPLNLVAMSELACAANAFSPTSRYQKYTREK